MKEILLIDDADFSRMLLRSMLQKNGYKICGEASNGKEGLEKYKQLKPDMVICDIMMDEVDGLGCLNSILGYDPEAKVMICSSISEKPYIDEIMAIGAKGFLKKPVQIDDLIFLTNQIVGGPVDESTNKGIMTKEAEKRGIENRALLDFFEAFLKAHGFSLDDATVDDDYIKNNGDKSVIAVRAMLSAKLGSKEIDELSEIFLNIPSLR